MPLRDLKLFSESESRGSDSPKSLSICNVTVSKWFHGKTQSLTN